MKQLNFGIDKILSNEATITNSNTSRLHNYIRSRESYPYFGTYHTYEYFPNSNNFVHFQNTGSQIVPSLVNNFGQSYINRSNIIKPSAIRAAPKVEPQVATRSANSQNESSSCRRRSWSRAVFSSLQRKGLEKRFALQKYITKPDRRQLAATLGLTDAQVKVWFQNRRMKWRHTKEDNKSSLTESQIHALRIETTQLSISNITLENNTIHNSDDEDIDIESDI